MISLEAACPALPLRKNSACAVFTEGRLRLGRAYRNHCLSGLIVNVGNISSKALFHGHLPRYRLFENLSCTIEPPDVKQETIQTHSAGLENPKAQGDRFFGSSEWKTLPDIWRTASERFPENIAVVDPHHHPATAMTYAQVSVLLKILDSCSIFSHSCFG
ncbi:hypothetical protein KP509_1Z165000 [Ceratopteris richardii]|nr:hypothetical protein KP509_1Z165000 [Ceratopteris richardii]